MKHFIYGLVDPFTHKINYVGQTNDLYKRWKDHIKGDSGIRKVDWIRRLQMSGVEPILIVLEETDAERVDEREGYWIHLGFTQGWPLTNDKRDDPLFIAERILADQVMLERAIDHANQREFVSVSSLQRHLNTGYDKVKSLIKKMIEYGILDSEFVEGKGFRVVGGIRGR